MRATDTILLREQIMDDMTILRTGQAMFSPLVLERQLIMLEAKRMQDGGMEIAKMNFPVHRT